MEWACRFGRLIDSRLPITNLGLTISVALIIGSPRVVAISPLSRRTIGAQKQLRGLCELPPWVACALRL